MGCLSRRPAGSFKKASVVLQLENARHHHSRCQHLLLLDKLLCPDRIPPETAGNQKQQCDPEQKAALPFKTGFANQFFQRSVGNQSFAPGIRFWSPFIVPGTPISCNSISKMSVKIPALTDSAAVHCLCRRSHRNQQPQALRSDGLTLRPTRLPSRITLPAESFSLGTQSTSLGQFSAVMAVTPVVLPSPSDRGCSFHDSLAFHSEQ